MQLEGTVTCQLILHSYNHCTQKSKFSIEDLFSKCGQTAENTFTEENFLTMKALFV